MIDDAGTSGHLDATSESPQPKRTAARQATTPVAPIFWFASVKCHHHRGINSHAALGVRPLASIRNHAK
jgi:hypothetical protein